MILFVPQKDTVYASSLFGRRFAVRQGDIRRFCYKTRVAGRSVAVSAPWKAQVGAAEPWMESQRRRHKQVSQYDVLKKSFRFRRLDTTDSS
jgi:hypothetical protein